MMCSRNWIGVSLSLWLWIYIIGIDIDLVGTEPVTRLRKDGPAPVLLNPRPRFPTALRKKQEAALKFSGKTKGSMAVPLPAQRSLNKARLQRTRMEESDDDPGYHLDSVDYEPNPEFHSLSYEDSTRGNIYGGGEVINMEHGEGPLGYGDTGGEATNEVTGGGPPEGPDPNPQVRPPPPPMTTIISILGTPPPPPHVTPDEVGSSYRPSPSPAPAYHRPSPTPTPATISIPTFVTYKPSSIINSYGSRPGPSTGTTGVTGSGSYRPTGATYTPGMGSSRPPPSSSVPPPPQPPPPGTTEFPPPPVPPPNPPDSPVVTGPTGTRTLFSGRKGSFRSASMALRRPVGGESTLLRQAPIENLRESKAEDQNVITDFVFSNIKCYRTKQKEYFGATIHLKNGFHLPYIRDRPGDPLTSSQCFMERTENVNSYHMMVTDLRGCGVEQCGGDGSMCLTMVFPRVPTLALAEDEVTTIKCLPQKSTMSEMRTISFVGDSLESRRSSSTVEGGGQDFAAEVGVFRQNSGTQNGLFVKRVNSGGVVQLGEPLQLRSVVRGGDGWTFSKLTDVKVWRMRDTYSHNLEKLNPNDASEVITMVDGRGCRNQEYKVIADSHPLRDPRNDLVHHFTFKAFLFRGQRANEPLIVTAKVQACQDPEDCITDECEGSSPNINRDFDGLRYKRSSGNGTGTGPRELKNSSSIIHDWNSQLALRVVGLLDPPGTGTLLGSDQEEDEEDSFVENNGLNNNNSGHPHGRSVSSHSGCLEKMAAGAFAGAFLMLLLATLLFTLASLCRRGGRSGGSPGYMEAPPPPGSRALPQQPQPQPERASILKRPNSSLNPNRASSKSLSGPRVNKPLPEIPVGPNPSLTLRDPQNGGSNGPRGRVGDGGQDPSSSQYELIGHNNLKDEDARSSGASSESSENLETLDKTDPSNGLYIVYCCGKNSKMGQCTKKRSGSAPPTLRDGRGEYIDGGDDFPDLEGSEDESDLGLRRGRAEDGTGSKRTVRSVKLRSQRQLKSRELRRKLTAIYREVHSQGQGQGSRAGGSFPSRSSGKKSFPGVEGGKAGSSSVRVRHHHGQQGRDDGSGGGSGSTRSNPRAKSRGKIVNFIDDLSDELSSSTTQVSSDLDSAYCGSSSVGSTNGRDRETHRIEARRLPPKAQPTSTSNEGMLRPKPLRRSNVDQKKSRIESDESGLSQSMTHFVTRNEGSTQIIIIPETNV